MKPTILILSTKSEHYEMFKQALIGTWIKTAEAAGFQVFMYEAGHSKNAIKENTIYLKGDDSLKATFTKFQDALRFLKCEGVSVDFVFRTNLSSYIDVDAFIKFLGSNAFDRLSYDGVCGHTYFLREWAYLRPAIAPFSRLLSFGNKIHFVSGAGLFLGQSAVERLIDFDRSSKCIDAELIEDVEIARVLGPDFRARLKVERFDVYPDESQKVSLTDYQGLVEKGLFHYKFKSYDRFWDARQISKFHCPQYRRDFCVLKGDEL